MDAGRKEVHCTFVTAEGDVGAILLDVVER